MQLVRQKRYKKCTALATKIYFNCLLLFPIVLNVQVLYTGYFFHTTQIT
jgi:hypothetical protein